MTADAAARDRIRHSLDESLQVEAAAGTGKTTVLVERLVSLLATRRAKVEGVVAVTFTRKAAGELELRLREQLDRRRTASTDAAERAALEDAIERLEEARIGTIHGFCAELLRERPVELGIDPDFVELDEEEAAALFRQTFDRWVQDALAEGSEGLRRALSRLSLWHGSDPPLARLASAAWQLADWRDHPTPWRREPFDRAGEVDALVGEVAALAALAAQGPDEHALRRALRCVEEEARWIERAEAAGPRDLDLVEARLVNLARQMRRESRVGGGKRYGPLERADVVAARAALLAKLAEFEKRADADLAALLRDALAGCLDAYAARKRREGKLDFLDLLLLARNLVRDDATVRGAFQRRFTHLFVDEVQDIDPLQAELLVLLAADDPAETDWRRARPRPGALFLVGDPKQSIYRFRRADLTLYQDLSDRLAEQGVARLELSTSYRSVRTIQRAVNAAFAPVMTGDRESGQPSYIALGEDRGDLPGQPAVVALPVPHPLGKWGDVTKWAVEASLPSAVGGFLQWLLEESGWQVEERGVDGPRRVPVAPRHVAVLFRRFVSWNQDVSQPYLRELESRNLPHVVLGGRSFHGREEVETLRTALAAIEHPDDSLSVFATLKGGLFALGDDALLVWKHRVGSFHPFRARPADLPESLAPVADALDLLARLHRQRNRVPVGETLHELLRATRAHAGFALRPAGHQVVANVQQVAELARGFESRGGLSFRRFVEKLDAQAGAFESRQGAVVEEGAEGIRLLTVHSAKGLEFPVVILADATARLARDEPGRYVDSVRGLWAAPLLGWRPWDLHDHAEGEAARDAEEGRRLAYVAATRARDLLVVPATGVGHVDGWVADLNRAIYPSVERRYEADEAPGSPRRGTATVLGLADGFSGEPPRSIRPGLHVAREGGHEVAWFDPLVLNLSPPDSFGLRQEHLLAEPSDPAGVASDLERHAAWQRRRAEASAAAAAPTLAVSVVTAREDDPPTPALLAEESLPRVEGRPTGKRFGALVHDVLREVPLAAERDAIGALAATRGRLLAATREEIEAAVEVVEGALAHRVLRDGARNADEVHRELPFCLPLPSGGLVEGVVDLLYRDESGWTVVDWKTEEPGPFRAVYRRQLAWYVWSVATATGSPARGLLVWL
jgi:ATP-dependent exoDNAse (exonuclease V) beta subunit